MTFTKTSTFMTSVLASIFLFATTTAAADNQATADTAHYLTTIQNNPNDLLLFLESMPKGADLHNHLSGATYAEDLLQDAAKDNLCLNPQTDAITIQTNCIPADRLANISQNADLYNSVINAWSLRDFSPVRESEHDHFFAIFGKVYPLIDKHLGQILAEVVNRAGAQHEDYIELMVTPGDVDAGALDNPVKWNPDLAQLRQKLLMQGVPRMVKTAAQHVTDAEAVMRSQLMCGTAKAQPGCRVKVRYLYIALREQPPEAVFTQLLTGFELAAHDPRFVGINVVQAEDGYIALRDYDLHMHMISFLHKLYPTAGISLHAGELAPGQVDPQQLTFHIRHAVEMGGAQRIGHGVDIAHEDNAPQLLQEMANKPVDVEINLTSNADLLGIQGADHPLPLYLQYHVPVTLSTDDEGILRTDLTQEYQRAVRDYHLSYPTLKNIVRNSITYSFLPGSSLWQDAARALPVTACQHDVLGTKNPSASCQAFLAQNEKANMQWQLENDFDQFESKFKTRS